MPVRRLSRAFVESLLLRFSPAVRRIKRNSRLRVLYSAYSAVVGSNSLRTAEIRFAESLLSCVLRMVASSGAMYTQ